METLRNLTTERLLVGILFVLIFSMAVRIPADTDTWWHLRAGDAILETGHIPHEDTFSHTRDGAEWIDHSWGAQVVMVGFYRLFGGGDEPGAPGNVGLAIYTALLATAGMAFVYRMCEGTAYLRAFVVVLGAATAAVFWSPRPQMFSFLLGAVTLTLLHQFKRERIDRLWLIPPIVTVWANLHGGFAIAFIFLLGTLAGGTLGRLLNPADPRVVSWHGLRKLLLVTLVSAAAVALNPYGVQMLAYPFRTISIGALQDFIQEWGSPDFHEPQAWPFAALLLGVLAAAGLSARRLDWTDLVLVGGTALMGLMAGRNVAVFAIAATPVLSRHVSAWLDERGWQIQPVRRVRGRQRALNWALLLVAVLIGLLRVVVTLDRETVATAQAEMFPVELAAYLDASPPPGEMFNSYNWGGYLMFAAPDVPVYVDGRTDLYDDAFLRRYLSVALIREGWADALDEDGIDFVAIEGDSFLAQMLRTQPTVWHEMTFDEGRSALFVRKGAPDG